MVMAMGGIDITFDGYMYISEFSVKFNTVVTLSISHSSLGHTIPRMKPQQSLVSACKTICRAIELLFFITFHFCVCVCVFFPTSFKLAMPWSRGEKTNDKSVAKWQAMLGKTQTVNGGAPWKLVPLASLQPNDQKSHIILIFISLRRRDVDRKPSTTFRNELKNNRQKIEINFRRRRRRRRLQCLLKGWIFHWRLLVCSIRSADKHRCRQWASERVYLCVNEYMWLLRLLLPRRFCGGSTLSSILIIIFFFCCYSRSRSLRSFASQLQSVIHWAMRGGTLEIKK